MKIHKEGYGIILRNTILSVSLSLVSYYCLPIWASAPIIATLMAFIIFHIRFFRVPTRQLHPENNNIIYSPADGTVVAIEETDENEYLNEKRIQISIFMSIWNVHINWFPIGGNITYQRHHHGKFLVAWHPKSSTENERTTTVINTGTHDILFRQIAGSVARRIVNYANPNNHCTQSHECGFIKFGSRVDLFLPLGSEINIELNQKVVGTQTQIAILPPKIET